MSPISQLREDEEPQLLPLTVDDGDGIMEIGEFREIEVEFTLDSGACNHVMDAETNAPGYRIRDSPGSRRGQNFLAADGRRIPNEGEVVLNLMAPNGGGGEEKIELTSQVAEITRPLLSVSKLCEKGYTCLFTKDGGDLLDAEGRSMMHFKEANGLYTASMKLRPPESFRRRAA